MNFNTFKKYCKYKKGGVCKLHAVEMANDSWWGNACLKRLCDAYSECECKKGIKGEGE